MKRIIDDAFLSMLESHDLCVKKKMNGLFGGNRRSAKYGSSTEFADYRKYEPGDDLRRIDGNLYARFQKLFIKLFTDERQLHHRIYLDTSSSMDWGEPKKSETALRLAAAFAYLAVQSLDRVSIATLSNQDCTELCARFTGKEGFYAAANKLNRVTFEGESDIGKGLLSDYDFGSIGGLSIVISDFLTDSDWKSGIDRILHAGREVCLVRILSRDEITPEFSGKVLMHDREAINDDDSRHYKTEVTRSAIKAYEEALLWHQNEIRSFADSRGISLITVCSDESIEKMLFLKATEANLIQ